MTNLNRIAPLLTFFCCYSFINHTYAIKNLQGSKSVPIDLFPEIPRFSEEIPTGTTRTYRVHQLKSDRVYNVKISYPANVPTDFSFDMQLDSFPVENNMNLRRRRLNTAMTRLNPSELLERRSASIEVPLAKEMTVLVSVYAKATGVSRYIDLSNRSCVYDIVVEEMLFGVLPRHSLAMIAWAFFLLILVKKYVYSYMLKKISLSLPEDQILREKEYTKEF